MMARDIKLFFDTYLLTGDVKYQNGDLVREEGLETAVMISLYTDRRASESDILDDPNDKRGWWGDLVPDTGDRIGSKLWQHDRDKSTDQNIIKIKQAVKECLQWMIDDGVANKIEVTAEKFGEAYNYRLGITTKIYRRFSDKPYIIKFDDLWEAEYESSGG